MARTVPFHGLSERGGLAIYTSNHPRIFNASDFIHIIISDDWLTWAGLCGFDTIWLHNAFDAWQFFKPRWIWRFTSSWQWLILTHETDILEWLPLCIWLLFDTETESNQFESECDSDLKLNLSVTLISNWIWVWRWSQDGFSVKLLEFAKCTDSPSLAPSWAPGVIQQSTGLRSAFNTIPKEWSISINAIFHKKTSLTEDNSSGRHHLQDFIRERCHPCAAWFFARIHHTNHFLNIGTKTLFWEC